MIEKRKNEEMVLRHQYDSLSNPQKEELRKRVIEESGMSYPAFYFKLRNNSFKPLEVKLINEIINELNK